MNTRSKAERTGERRAAILTSAQGAIRRLGLRKAGMREIARAAGLSTGNLYYYFRNKEELVYYCQDRTLDALLTVIDEAAGLPSSAERLAVLVRGHLKVLLDPRIAGAMHLDFEGLPKPLLKKLVEKRDRYEKAVRQIIQRGHAAGELEARDPKLATFALLGALNWAARWYRPDGALSVDDVVDVFVPQLLHGLLR